MTVLPDRRKGSWTVGFILFVVGVFLLIQSFLVFLPRFFPGVSRTLFNSGLILGGIGALTMAAYMLVDEFTDRMAKRGDQL